MKKKSPDTLTVLDFGVLPNHPRLTVPVTLFKGTSAEPFQCITLGNLLSEIETTDINKLKDSQSMVCLYEAYLQNGDKAQKASYDKKKLALNGFLIGNFSKRGDAKSNCVEYVPCLVFDLDGCKSTYDCFLYHTQLQALDFVFATFPSPSGYGLRILVWTTATYETHRIVYQQILAALCAHLNLTTDRNDGIHFDSSCQNESRHFFYVAVDKKLFYLNLESKTFEIHSIKPGQQEDSKKDLLQNKEKRITVKEKTEVIDYDELMALLDKQLVGAFEGRNDRLFHLTMRFKNNDVPISAAERYVTKFVEMDFTIKEILNTVKSAYKIAKVQFSDEQKVHFLGQKEDSLPPNEGHKREKEPILKNKKLNTSESIRFDKEVILTIEQYRQLRRDKMPSKSMNAQVNYRYPKGIAAS